MMNSNRSFWLAALLSVVAHGAVLGVLVLAISAWGLWLLRRAKLATSRVFLHVAVWAAVLPFLMNTAGWFLTESGQAPLGSEQC